MKNCTSCGRRIYEGKYVVKQYMFYYCWKCAKKLRKLGKRNE
jgi:predicted RNA-binding Zn-ribbon protein involved in translation (DUF1610 family)